MSPDTATMVAATITAATFAAVMPSATGAAREGWRPVELQRAAATAAGVSLAGGALLAGIARSGAPLYVSGALALGLGLVYQLAAVARVR